MSDEAALIAGIREHPLDDLRRLVYADWLDERGRTEQAEYLRLVTTLVGQYSPIHAERLDSIARGISWEWRNDVGRRFDVLSEDSNDLSSFVMTYEAAMNVTAGWAHMGSPNKYIIIASGESSVLNLPAQDILLGWLAKTDSDLRAMTSLEVTISALDHIRRILLAHDETVQLATVIPPSASESMSRFAVILEPDVSDLDANHRVRVWRELLHLSTDLDGEGCEPPFSGWIGVTARSRNELESI